VSTPLGNLSPFALDLRRERTDLGIPSRHLRGPGPGTLPHTGPSCHMKSGFEWLWEAPTRQGWEESRGRGGAERGQAPPRRTAAECREAGRQGGKYCLYRAGDHGSLAESRARLSVRPGSWSPGESELPDRDPGLEMSKQRETQMIDLTQLIPKGQTGFSTVAQGRSAPALLIPATAPPSALPPQARPHRDAPRGGQGHPQGLESTQAPQGPSALAENIPPEASLWGVKTLQVHTS